MTYNRFLLTLMIMITIIIKKKTVFVKRFLKSF